MTGQARLETQELFDGMPAPVRPSIFAPRDRSSNLSSLAEVARARDDNEQECATELEPIKLPPPDPEITRRWASVLGGGVHFVQHDGTVKDGPQTSGAAKRLASLRQPHAES